MRPCSRLLATAAFLLLPAVARAQTTISGRVLAQDRGPVSDVAVTIPELGVGAVTRDDGRYSITIPGARALGQTVTLNAPDGPVTARVVPAEGGSLAFVYPANPLQSIRSTP